MDIGWGHDIHTERGDAGVRVLMPGPVERRGLESLGVHRPVALEVLGAFAIPSNVCARTAEASIEAPSSRDCHAGTGHPFPRTRASH